MYKTCHISKTDKSYLSMSVTLQSKLCLPLLNMLALLSFLFFAGYHCSSCDDFTVGSCSPDQSQTILSLDLPNSGEQWQLCENLCNVQEDCEFWSLSTCMSTSQTCKCSLLTYSYLHSCEIVGGGVDTDIEVSAS